ncbi:hypothetical protein SBA3_3200023 [Candidatus Sulfopaludibacter sp. SbA3]|nr:hypothetical protein SBA3_3200023 [Candidatus Sulfopaludibacter sp. SbA3]
MRRRKSYFQGKHTRSFQPIERTALRKLFHLNRAVTLRDLALIPGNRLELLERNRKGQYRIRVNSQRPESQTRLNHPTPVDHHYEHPRVGMRDLFTALGVVAARG